MEEINVLVMDDGSSDDTVKVREERMRIENLPVESNTFSRTFRLYKGMMNFMVRQGGTIIRL